MRPNYILKTDGNAMSRSNKQKETKILTSKPIIFLNRETTATSIKDCFRASYVCHIKLSYGYCIFQPIMYTNRETASMFKQDCLCASYVCQIKARWIEINSRNSFNTHWSFDLWKWWWENMIFFMYIVANWFHIKARWIEINYLSNHW